MRSLTRAHSPKQPILVTTTFSNFRGGRLRERRLYICFFSVDRIPSLKKWTAQLSWNEGRMFSKSISIRWDICYLLSIWFLISYFTVKAVQAYPTRFYNYQRIQLSNNEFLNRTLGVEGGGGGLRFTWLDSKYPDAIVSEQAQSHS